MKRKFGLFLGTLLLASSAANAGTTINLYDLGGVTGSHAELGFKVAAAYWSSVLTNNATIDLGVSFAPLPQYVIGSTGSNAQDYTFAAWEAGVNATKSGSTIDQSIVLPSLNGSGGATFISNGPDGTGYLNAASAYKTVINGDTVSSQLLYANSSVIKAIGGTVSGPPALDGEVTFSSDFSFDFDPRNGITAGQMDFIGVAIHEIGHALGFVSGVDYTDLLSGPNGPYAGALTAAEFNDTSWYAPLDMFRYSNDPTNLVAGSSNVLDFSVGGTRFFSVDGGVTALFGNTMSTGSFNGDGNQASHWKDTAGCAVGNGIMDPTFCYGQTGTVTGLDLAAFDAIGWNLSSDALTYANKTTAQILFDQIGTSAIPEPSSWLMLIFGFGLVGAAARRRAGRVELALA